MMNHLWSGTGFGLSDLLNVVLKVGKSATLSNIFVARDLSFRQAFLITIRKIPGILTTKGQVNAIDIDTKEFAVAVMVG